MPRCNAAPASGGVGGRPTLRLSWLASGFFSSSSAILYPSCACETRRTSQEVSTAPWWESSRKDFRGRPLLWQEVTRGRPQLAPTSGTRLEWKAPTPGERVVPPSTGTVTHGEAGAPRFLAGRDTLLTAFCAAAADAQHMIF